MYLFLPSIFLPFIEYFTTILLRLIQTFVYFSIHLQSKFLIEGTTCNLDGKKYDTYFSFVVFNLILLQYIRSGMSKYCLLFSLCKRVTVVGRGQYKDPSTTGFCLFWCLNQNDPYLMIRSVTTVENEE